MAWYSGCSLHYRGRLVDVSLRYGCIDDPRCIRVVRGKPLRFTWRDIRRLDRLIARKPETRHALESPDGHVDYPDDGYEAWGGS